MFTIPGPFTAKLAAGTWAPVYLFKIQLANGTTYRYADLDVNVITDINDGAGVQTFFAATMVDFAETQHSNDTEINTAEVSGVVFSLATTGVDHDTILATKLDQSYITIAVCDLDDLASGGFALMRGTALSVSIEDQTWKVSVASAIQQLNFEPFRRITPECLQEFGDARCGFTLVAPTWQATTAYTTSKPGGAAGTPLGFYDQKLTDIVKPSVFNGFDYLCLNPGTSGGTEPTWPTTLGATVVDGSVTWETIATSFWPAATVTQIVSKRKFLVDVTGIPDGWFDNGKAAFTAGRLQDKTIRVLNFVNQAVPTTSLQVYMPLDGPNVESIAPASYVFNLGAPNPAFGMSYDVTNRKYGAASLQNDAQANIGGIAIDDATYPLRFTNGEFTVAFWARFRDLNQPKQILCARWENFGPFSWQLYRLYNNLVFEYSQDGSTTTSIISSNIDWDTLNFHHILINRTATNTFTMFFDGQIVAQADFTGITFNTLAGTPFTLYRINGLVISIINFQGWMDDVIIRHGAGAGTSDVAFTPPRKAYGTLFGAGVAEIDLLYPPAIPVQLGDTLDLTAGCLKSIAACAVHHNEANHRGFPYVPGTKIVRQRGTKTG